MPIIKSQHRKVLSFSNGWVASNIMVGPFSTDDLSIYDGPIALFRKEAAQAGLSEEDLENTIGPVPEFIARAYADALSRWHATRST